MGKKGPNSFRQKKSGFALGQSLHKPRQAGRLGGKPPSKRNPDTLKQKIRSGREAIPETLQFDPLASIPDFTPEIPESSTVFVVGKARIDYWTESLWQDFRRFRGLGQRLGLAVQITPVADYGESGKTISKRWTRRRIDLEVALAHIKDEPGILFDDWARLWLSDPDRVSPEIYEAARAKAANNLSRLFRTEQIIKRYDAGGFLRLHAIKQDGSIIE